MFKRIRNWFKKRVEYKQLAQEYELLNLNYQNLKDRKIQIETKLDFLLQQAAVRKMLQIVQIVTEYENNLRHPVFDGRRIEKMDKTLQKLCKVIAGKNDTLVFWRISETIIKNYFGDVF